MTLANLRIDGITVGERRRKDVGDLSELCESITAIGLLHPIVVSTDNQLIVGHRRLVAFIRMGRTEIPATIAANISDVLQGLTAERDENICRKDFTIEEAVGMYDAIAAVEKPKAAERRKETQGRPRKGEEKTAVNFTEVNRSEREATAIAAKAVGMSRPTVERAREVLASGDATLIAEMNRTGKVNGVAKRLKVAKQSKQLEAKPVPLPSGRFDVIVIDPPWQYDARALDPTHRSANPYPSMTIDAIAALPIPEHAEDNCVLWLWTTNSHLPKVWKIIEAWGFEYKTMLTWAKHKMGMGDWLRGQTEHCLLCVRGKPTIRLTNQTTLLSAKSGEHSAKPDEFYQLVAKLCPGTKLEMFSRRQRKGFVGFGDEHGDAVQRRDAAA